MTRKLMDAVVARLSPMRGEWGVLRLAQRMKAGEHFGKIVLSWDQGGATR